MPSGSFVTRIPTKTSKDEKITFQAPASSLFAVDPNTGDVRTKLSLDYESGVTTHNLRILANTSTNTRLSIINLQILTASLDEYAPQFHQPRGYNFSFSRNSYPGNIIGEVRARDRDDGPDGFISYSIVSRVGIPYFTIDSTRGAIILSKSLDSSAFEYSTSRDKIDGIIRLKVEAKSKQPDSLRTIVLDRTRTITRNSWTNRRFCSWMDSRDCCWLLFSHHTISYWHCILLSKTNRKIETKPIT